MKTHIVAILLAACESGKHQEGELYCYGYASSVCANIQSACLDEMASAWAPEDSGDEPEYPGEDWMISCQAEVVDDCARYYVLAGAGEEENVQYVIQATCAQGYAPSYALIVDGYECEDVSNGAPGFKPDWPYTDVCPCLKNGEYRTGPNGTECI